MFIPIIISAALQIVVEREYPVEQATGQKSLGRYSELLKRRGYDVAIVGVLPAYNRAYLRSEKLGFKTAVLILLYAFERALVAGISLPDFFAMPDALSLGGEIGREISRLNDHHFDSEVLHLQP